MKNLKDFINESLELKLKNFEYMDFGMHKYNSSGSTITSLDSRKKWAQFINLDKIGGGVANKPLWKISDAICTDIDNVYVNKNSWEKEVFDYVKSILNDEYELEIQYAHKPSEVKSGWNEGNKDEYHTEYNIKLNNKKLGGIIIVCW